MSFKEITDRVQRLEMLEERAGIEINGLMVTVDDASGDDEYQISIMGEVTALNGGAVEKDIDITINCYNANKQVCGTTTAYVYAEDFMGLETLNEFIFSKGFPSELKIVTKVSR